MMYHEGTQEGPSFSALEAQYGLPAGYPRTDGHDRKRRKPERTEPQFQRRGMFQFIDSTAKQYGLTDKTDPLASADALRGWRLTTGPLSGEGTPGVSHGGELYLAHQQKARAGLPSFSRRGMRLPLRLSAAMPSGWNGGNAGMTAAFRWQVDRQIR